MYEISIDRLLNDVETQIHYFMKLTVKERIGILNILPARGDVQTLLTARDIRQKVALSQDEQKKAGFNSDGRTWDNDFAADVQLTENEKHLIREQISSFEEQKILPDVALEVALKFKETGGNGEKKQTKEKAKKAE